MLGLLFRELIIFQKLRFYFMHCMHSDVQNLIHLSSLEDCAMPVDKIESASQPANVWYNSQRNTIAIVASPTYRYSYVRVVV